MNLLPSLGRRGVKLNLLTRKVDIEDTADASKYFDVIELDTVFTAGRNPVAFNGTSLLREKSEIQIECLDSMGNPLYFEQAKSQMAQFTDVTNFVISIHVYDDTYNGPAKLVFVGTAKDGKSVRWVRNISIDKTLTNARKVRFYDEPKLEVRPLLYPVVDLGKAQDFDSNLYSDASAVSHVTGIVTSVRLVGNNTGSGYTTRPDVVFSGGGVSVAANHARATAYIDVARGAVTNITVDFPGFGYTSTPGVSLDYGGYTTRALAAASFDKVVYSASVTSPGSGYTTVPSVQFDTDGGGVGATGYAEVLNEKVVRIRVDSQGSGYVSAPTVLIGGSRPTEVSELNVSINFVANVYGSAVLPKMDTNQALVNRKRIDIDYRIVATSISDSDAAPSLAQTGSFNSQMEGRDIELTITKIKLPLSHQEKDVNLTETFRVKKVLDTRTIVVADPFYYQVGNNKFVANIVQATCRLSYNYIKYNTSPDSVLRIIPPNSETGEPVSVKESYVEATYRNIKPFSGFIARHKLYRRSLFYPGEFQQISDEPLNAVELLTDTVTYNRAYYQLGKFYHQFHISKYWFTSSNDMSLTAKSIPLNAMYISFGSPNGADGSKYVIVKTDTIGDVNKNNVYYPYNASEFNQLSGSSYNSNFINLKKDALHSFTTTLVTEKDKDVKDAKISFYFTSSIEDIKLEKEYDPAHGWRLGEIKISDDSTTKYFDKPQTMYFTPSADYYGTLKIVPYHCNATISDVSLKSYGDTGFSPEVLVIRVPCPLNVSNEAFEFKAELYDINHILIPTELQATNTFDPSGESMYATDDLGQVLVIQNDGDTIISNTETFIVNNDLVLPNLDPDCEIRSTDRLIKWDGRDGTVKRTNVIGLRYDDQYVVLTTGSCAVFSETGSGKAVNVSFDGVLGGRQIYWVTGTTKQIDTAN